MDYTDADFHLQISQLLKEQKTKEAIIEISKAIQSAEDDRKLEDACYLYSQLAGVLFIEENAEKALAILEECERKYPDSPLAKFLYLENIYWHARDFNKAIKQADSIIEMAAKYYNVYYKAVYLKAMSYVEIGQLDKAVEMLDEIHYYDLALVEKLIAHRTGLGKCLSFLLRALKKHEEYKTRGEDVESTIIKINTMIAELDKLNAKVNAGTTEAEFPTKP